MILELSKKQVGNPYAWLRSRGYSLTRSQTDSLERRLQPGQSWPRFHVYLEDEQEYVKLNIHLDHKQETRHYQNNHAHNAEYDGPEIAEELTRLKQSL